MKLGALAVPLLALVAIAATSLLPDTGARGDARFVKLVTVDEAGLVLRPDGTASRLTAFSLLDARGTELLYARVRGRWRCLTHFAAPADTERITALVSSLVSARALDATPRRDVADWIGAHGLGLDVARRIVLRGPDALKEAANGDVLAELLVGANGAARRVVSGEPLDEVLQLAQRFDEFFESPVTRDANSVPPLVSARVVPADWVGFQSGLARVFFDRADGTGFELVRAIDPELPTGLTAWDLRESPTEPWRRAHPVLATGYTLFLGRTPIVRALDPRSVPPALTANPEVRITLVSAAGDLAELCVGPPDERGARQVVNTDTQAAYELAPEPSRLLVPPTTLLEIPGASIPWDPYLR